MTEKRPGPVPGVPLIEVSVKRELTVIPIRKKGKKLKKRKLKTVSLSRAVRLRECPLAES